MNPQVKLMERNLGLWEMEVVKPVFLIYLVVLEILLNAPKMRELIKRMVTFNSYNMELFETVKVKLRTHKGRYASKKQYEADEKARLEAENKKLKKQYKRIENALELEQRKQPAWIEYRKYTSLKEQFDKMLKERDEEITQLQLILKNIKK